MLSSISPLLFWRNFIQHPLKIKVDNKKVEFRNNIFLMNAISVFKYHNLIEFSATVGNTLQKGPFLPAQMGATDNLD